MILADKILALRKKNGWSQEELADKLNVSRQSISKWEGAIAIPDISKIIEMGKIFGVTTDYLLKDDIEETIYSNDDDANVRKINLDTANSYLKASKTFNKQVGLGASLCIISPILLIILSALTEYSTKVTEKFAVSMGLSVLFLLVCLAVALFIVSDSMMKKYSFINKEKFELEYGVDSIVKERRENFIPKFNYLLILAISLIILGVLPLVISAIYDASGMVIISMVGLLLFIVSIATTIIINIVGIKSSFDRLLCEGEFENKKVLENTKEEKISNFYWPLIVAIYLAWSFISRDWHITWIVWPVASLIFAAISSIIKTEN